MLRITEIGAGRDGRHRLLKVEGKLVDPWVAELSNVCLPPANDCSNVRLDLSDLTYVDRSGIEVLRDLIDRGISIVACSAIVAELINEEGL